MNWIIAAIVGFFGGVSSGLFGVGGGVVMVPAMTLLMGMGIKEATGTSLAVIIPTAIMGTWKQNEAGKVIWPVAGMLVLFAVLGGYTGAMWQRQIPAANLQRAFGVFIALAGLKLALGK